MQQQLFRCLLGALDDKEQQSVETRLEHDMQWLRHLAHWRQRSAPPEASGLDFEPPAGLAERTCRYVASYRLASAESSLSRITGRS
jgi:anti-sigma-K factor RskA